MIFVGLTILRLKQADEKDEQTFPNGLRVRYRVENVTHYQEYRTLNLLYI